MRGPRLLGLLAAALVSMLPLFAKHSFGHGDVTPQAVDTTGLAPLGDEWRTENPYRGDAKAVEIGTSGYAQNCARCHGLQVISGGLAPDLRKLEPGAEGDAWYIERVRNGATIGDVTRMPRFEGLLSQEAIWAIRSYVESQHVE